MELRRFWRHFWCDRGVARRAFPVATMRRIETAIAANEARHDGELRFAVEALLPLSELMRGVSAHHRAVEMFSRLRVWDTERNSGVLIYLLLADKRVEIVADRGIHRKVGDAAWGAICGNMQRAFAGGEFERGAILAIDAIGDLLAIHFPPQPGSQNELPNRPVIL